MEQIDPLNALFSRARDNSISMAAICKRADMAATTPSRWKRKKNGANLDSINRLNDALNAIIAERSQAAA